MTSRRVGRRFRPCEEFLVSILDWKRKGKKFDLSATTEVPGALAEMGMYGPGKEPWRIFSGDHEILELHETCDLQKKVREKYVVTKLKRIGKKNFSRRAGDGLWLDKSKKKPVYVGGQEVGHWRTLTYEYSGGDGVEEGKSHYYMNELHLSKPSDYVVCRVMKNLSKGCRVKRGSKRPRQGGDVRRAAKRSRREETPESSSCSEVVYDEDDEEESSTSGQMDDDEFEVKEEVEEFTSEPIHLDEFSGLVDVKEEESILVYDPAEHIMSIPVLEQEELDSFYSASVYVPDMLGVEQCQEEQVPSEWFRVEQSWVPSCSSTFLDQSASQDQWLEELLSMRQDIF